MLIYMQPYTYARSAREFSSFTHDDFSSYGTASGGLQYIPVIDVVVGTSTIRTICIE